MDEWTTSDYRGMLARGNAAANATLEASLADFPAVRKPSMLDGGDDMHKLEAYVRAKYVSKSFILGGDGAVEALGGGGAAGASSSAYVGATVEYTGMLHVRVVSAAGLPSMDVGSPSGPYVVVKLPPGQERRTKTVWNCNDPRWGESLMFNTGNLEKQTLEVWVWDEDLVKQDDVIGVARFPLSQLIDDHGAADDDDAGAGAGDGGTGTGTEGRRVTLPLVKAEGNKSLMSKVFGCCVGGAGGGGDLGSVTVELNFIPLNNE
jgi:hypothetical protein